MNTNIYLVLGMHRSGTSLVSGLLHQSGIIMGTDDNFIPKPNSENPKGFFENFEFRQINDRVLANCGYVVKDWDCNFQPNRGSLMQKFKLQRQMAKLLQKYAEQYSHWGWKDPRQMLTCPPWFKALKSNRLNNSLKIIFVYRHPLNVAISLYKRGNIENIAHGLELWYLYNQTAFSFMQKHQIPCLTFSFDNLIQNTPTVMSSLSSFIELDLKPEVYNQFIEQKLVRSQENKAEIKEYERHDRKVQNLLENLINLENKSL